MSDLTVTGNGLLEKLKQDMKNKFMDLIPDEEWEIMIMEEFKKFTTASKGNYNRESPSEMSVLVRAMIKDRVIKIATKELELSKFDVDIQKQVRKEIITAAPDIIASMVLTGLQNQSIIINNQH